jgi:hypothetical protein
VMLVKLVRGRRVSSRYRESTTMASQSTQNTDYGYRC